VKDWPTLVLHLVAVFMCAWSFERDWFWFIPYGFLALLFLGFFLANYLARSIVLHMAAVSIELRRRDNGR
jgi:hypothetical protein